MQYLIRTFVLHEITGWLGFGFSFMASAQYAEYFHHIFPPFMLFRYTPTVPVQCST